MQTAKVISLKEHRGAPRLWFQGLAPLRAGFAPGARYRVQKLADKPGVMLRLSDDGERLVSRKTYESGREVPVLDINSREELGVFEGCEAVRVVFGEGCVYVSPLASEQRRVKRLQRLRDKLMHGMELDSAGVCAGAGVLSHALHEGFNDAGVACRLAVHNEIREDLVEQVLEHNDIADERTKVLQMPLQELAFDNAVLERVGEVDVMELGLPCSGASVAGRAKRSLELPEEHPDVGHLVVGALALVARLNPAACVFENVPPYAKSASAVLIRQQLRDLGYETHEVELFGPDWGELEARRRWCLVALTRGIEFDLSTLVPEPFAVRTLADVLEPADSPALRWDAMRGLKAKQERDIADGKGFRMQVFDGSESRIATLTKGLAKNRSTDPKIRHPRDPQLLRIPTAAEHARCKGVPEHLIEGLSQTKAHEMLGQGIVYGPFRQVARHLARALKRWAERTASVTYAGAAFKAAA